MDRIYSFLNNVNFLKNIYLEENSFKFFILCFKTPEPLSHLNGAFEKYNCTASCSMSRLSCASTDSEANMSDPWLWRERFFHVLFLKLVQLFCAFYMHHLCRTDVTSDSFSDKLVFCILMVFFKKISAWPISSTTLM